MRIINELFNKGDLSPTLETYVRRIAEKVDAIQKDQFLATPFDDLVEHITNQIYIYVILAGLFLLQRIKTPVLSLSHAEGCLVFPGRDRQFSSLDNVIKIPPWTTFTGGIAGCRQGENNST